MHTGVKIDCIADTSYTDREVLERILDGREKPTNLSFTLLKDITENFSDGQEIGQGGFATVYKGVLPNWNVAVKRIKNNHSISETSFYREVDSLLNIEHKNVVRFLGFCASTYQTAIQIEGLKEHIYAEVRERLLCFEYISNGSLQKYITDELRGLEWSTRYEIIRGICEGLHHLHKEKQIYHMDLKPDNILLDNDMIPKITDFGLSRLDEKSKTMSEDRPGSLGYCAPEYLHQGKMSFKSDIYSLGVIIIELVTGENEIPGVNNNILRRWRHRWKRSGKESPLVYQQVEKCIEVGLICQDRDPSKRPFIWDMIHDIRQMEGVNGTIRDAPEHKFRQIHPYSADDMLGIEPLELHFRFQLNKHMSCSFQLTNETNSYMAFNVENTSPLPYCTQPHKGIMPPRSKCNVEIILQPQGKAPRDRCNEFIVWSTNVNDGLAIEDIPTNMFIKEADNVIDDVHLDVVFEADDTIPPLPQTIPPLLQSIDDAGWSIDSIDANQTEPLIITSRLFGYVQIWNYDTQELICSTKVSKGGVHDVKFIARKRWFVAVSPDHFVHVYEYGKNMQKITSLRAHDRPEGGDARCSLDVHPTLPYVLSGCGTQIKLWDWDQGWNCIQTFEEQSGEVRDVTFIPEDTNSFASASDYRLKVWSFDSVKSKYTLSGHSAGVLSMDFFTRDGHQYLITGSWDDTAKIWDMQKKECIHTLEHMSTVLCVLSHPNLPVLITGTRNGAVHVWSSTNFSLKTVLKLGNGEWVAGFACLMGSGSVAVAHQKGVSVIHIPDEKEQGGCCNGSNENSITATD